MLLVQPQEQVASAGLTVSQDCQGVAETIRMEKESIFPAAFHDVLFLGVDASLSSVVPNHSERSLCEKETFSTSSFRFPTPTTIKYQFYGVVPLQAHKNT